MLLNLVIVLPIASFIKGLCCSCFSLARDKAIKYNVRVKQSNPYCLKGAEDKLFSKHLRLGFLENLKEVAFLKRR